MIQLESVEKVYRTEKIETLALSNINLRVEQGEFISVMGPSGCGKSTLLNVMGLLDAPTQGSVVLGGQRVDSYADKYLARIRNEQIGFIFQTFHLISDLNVVDNVEIPLLYRQGMAGKERRQLALAALERGGLSSRVHHFPSQLSGGQQQRVAIARAIVGKPKLLLADEPTGNLDSQMGGEIMKILEGLNQEGTTVVMVTHDQQLAGRTGRIVRLFDGRQVN
ncbi:MAG: ABC transporter ATP-binding protein [Candidatus Latescibacteria bacterium]|nr:ABC transporter ATP-binding protein [Candidatus Latescibacterota bacterium]